MLLKLKENTLNAIRLAAEGGDSQRIRAETARLTEIETLIERQEALNHQVEALSKSDARTFPSSPVEEKESPASSSAAPSSREAGAASRNEFIQDCARKGIRLIPKRGVLYENSRREVVGIAFASEVKEDAWFLGLPSHGVKHAVLICEPRDGRAFRVCLPSRILQEYWPSLSENKGQVKFNVRRRGEHNYLIIPGVDPVQLDEYIDRPEHIN